MAQSVLNVNPDLIYSDVTTLLDGKINLQSYKPFQSSYSNGDTIDIKVQSNQEFIYMNRSFLQFKLTPTATQGTLSVLGANACINACCDVIGGVSTYPINNYNVLKAHDLETDTLEKKILNHVSNGYLPEELILNTTGSTFFSASKVTCAQRVIPTTGEILTIELPSQFNKIAQPLPLPFIQGGLQTSITLDGVSTVFPGSTMASYTVSDVQLITTMLQPRDDLLVSYQDLLAKGGSLVLPFVQNSCHTFAINAADTNNIKLNVGWRKSVNNIVVSHRAKAGTTAERFSASKIYTIKDWYLMSGSARYPRNFNIPVSTAQANPWIMLSSINNDVQSLNLGYVGKPQANDRSFLYWNFKSNQESFDNGLEISDGYIELLFNYAYTPSADDICQAFIEFDSILELDANTARIKN